MLKETHCHDRMKIPFVVFGILILGCNPRGAITVTGPSGDKMTVVLKEDDADLGTAKKLTKEAIKKFVKEENRLPKPEELRNLKVSWYGENDVGGITDIMSVEVEESSDHYDSQ